MRNSEKRTKFVFMKILFLVYHGFSEVSGISKKIHYQVKGLRENGHEVHLCYYDFSPEGHRCRYVDDQILTDYGSGNWAAIRQRTEYDSILDYCLKTHIQFVYARSFHNASPFLNRFFRKLRKAGIHSVIEIPTYPYESEYIGFPFSKRLGLHIDQLYRHQLASLTDAIVTFSDEQEIFGKKTIRISNGVDFESIPLHHTIRNEENDVHLIGVAEVHPWHGFDRLIHGLGEYYAHIANADTGTKVYFHIVGDVGQTEMEGSRRVPGFKTYIDRYDLDDYVIFHGALFGDELTDVFNRSTFAIGSLARHRSGITHIKTLKNREYATRGLPFIYSETDSDFDSQPYVLKAAPDESPIDIREILSFLDHFKMTSADIRKTVEHLSWKVQMAKVLEAFT